MTLDDLTDLILDASPEEQQRFADVWGGLPVPRANLPFEPLDRKPKMCYRRISDDMVNDRELIDFGKTPPTG